MIFEAASLFFVGADVKGGIADGWLETDFIVFQDVLESAEFRWQKNAAFVFLMTDVPASLSFVGNTFADRASRLVSSE